MGSGTDSRAVGVEPELVVRRRAVAGGASAVVDGPSRPPPSGAMLGGGRFAGTVLGAGRARGFGAGIEPGGGLEGGPRGFGTGLSGNLIASGALTGTTSTGDVCGCSTATGSATSSDAGPGTRGFFGCGWTGGDVARFPSGDGKADRAASNDA